MVQSVLDWMLKGNLRRWGTVSLFLLLFFIPAQAAKKDASPLMPAPPDLLLEGGRKLSFERSFSTEKEARGKPGFWTKLVNIVVGEPEYHELVRPYGIAVDSHGRAVITDPGARGVHIFDFEQHKYKFIQRAEKEKDPMLAPQCVAVDAQDNIYVTDSESGKIFVFEANGKFKRALGSLKGGEGFFKRPTGIAVDSVARRIYVTDTLRDKIFVLDMDGQVIQSVGQHGTGNGEFYFPTELHLDDHDLLVIDAMNFRVQFLDRSGNYEGTIGQVGDSPGQMFRPKGIGEDSEGHFYVVDGLWGMVQVFDREGRLLYFFGKKGAELGEFQLPSGLFIDHDDRIYVVDSYNRRVQVFRYYGLSKQARGVTH
jgi:DNA-binding beta-propeller fold protein YncE